MKLLNKFYDVDNPRDFWTQVGRIGIFNERKTSIPFEVLMDDNKVSYYYEKMENWQRIFAE